MVQTNMECGNMTIKELDRLIILLEKYKKKLEKENRYKDNMEMSFFMILSRVLEDWYNLKTKE